MKEKSIKDSIKKFQEESNPEDYLKDREYKKRRDTKRRKKFLIQRDQLIRIYRSLYLPTAICITVGCVVTLLSTLRGIGEKTFIWNYRYVFHYVGPIALALGVIVLLVLEGLHGSRKKVVKEKIARELSLKSNRSRTVSQRSILSQRSSLSNSVCHSIDDLSEMFPAVDFKAQTLTVPGSGSHRGKMISQISGSESKSTSCIFDRKNGLSQSMNSGGLKNTMTKLLRSSKSLSFSHQDVSKIADSKRRTEPDEAETGESKRLTHESPKVNGETVLNSHVGIRIVIQRPSTVGIEEEINLLPNKMGSKRNGFKSKRLIKRQNAVFEDDEENVNL
ncbi:hypothetical protein FSP39_005171 [Pinctada imbricata]|uniref:Transmembrane protein n=1 Tax=Pinctada imbricata TaxID=66713 RepID=A0AA88Y4Z1_PINIB|nr:hypothetical protein FSP39_005171 [Pinctada imbricata]